MFWILRVTTLLLALFTQFLDNYLPVVHLFQIKNYSRDWVRDGIISGLLSEERNWFAYGHVSHRSNLGSSNLDSFSLC